MADKKGLQKIGSQIPKIVLRAAGKDPKRLKKIRDLFGKKKQLKFPGMKKGKDVIVPPKKPKFQSEKDLPRAMRIDTTTSAYGDAGKGRPVPNFKKSKPGKKVGGMTAGAQSALGRLEKAQMVKNGYSAKSKPPKKEPYRDKGKGEYRKMKIGGLVDYYKDII